MKITKFNLLICLSLLFFGINATAQNDISFIKLTQPENNAAVEAGTSGFSTEKVATQIKPANPYRIDEWIAIGDASSPWGSYNYPIDFYWNTSLTQSIYTAGQINHGACSVEKLLYTYKTVSENYPDTIDTERIRVWMANTERESLSEADGFWMPLDQFTLVYDDTINFYKGENHELIFDLMPAFVYSGSNICIMVEHVFSDNAYENHFNFVASTLADGDIKSRLFSSYQTSFDFTLPTTDETQTGMTLGQIADVSLGITSTGGNSLSGTITTIDGGPIADATVVIANTDLTAISDAAGFYNFPYLNTGDYSIDVSALGYISANYNVTINGAVTLDIIMEYLPTSTVEGIVLDRDSVPITGATIQISGYEAHETISDASGAFVFTDVYYSDNYAISFSKHGYETIEQNLIVNQPATVLPTTLLMDILDVASKVEAVKTENSVDITWLSPLERTVFRRDGGNIITQFGHNYMAELAVFGQVYREPAKLYQMSWYTTFTDEYHEFVNVFVFALDAMGNPTNTILYERGNVPNTDDQWSTYTFPDTITVENGFYMALSYNGRLEIGIDAGGPEWPYVNNVNWVSEDYGTGEFLLMEELGLGELPGNFMIRAEGYNLNTGKELNNPVSENAKSLNYYKVYRLKQGDEQAPNQWQLLSDNVPETSFSDSNLEGLDAGWYRYAVVTVYSGETASEPSFSNAIEFGLTTQVTFNITTNTPVNESNGASITLKSNDGVYEYNKELVGSDGIVVFNDVFKGVYTIVIDHEYFEKITDMNIDLSLNPEYTMNYELIETLTQPYNLNITINNDTSVVFKWDFTEDIIEDFESYDNFAIAPQGTYKWRYFDLDGRPTVGIDNFDFPNENAPHAFMIFNPTSTNPPIDLELNPIIAPHLGDKFLASFGANAGQSNDLFISPKLHFENEFSFYFWAKSLVADPALNKMKVGYSTTGYQPEDFIWITETPVELAADKWQNYTYSLASDVKYVAINNVSDGGYVMMIDDVRIFGGESAKSKSLVNYEIFLNDVKMGETTGNVFTFAKEDIPLNTENVAGVKTIYSSAESEMSVISFQIGENSIADDAQKPVISAFPNPSDGTFTITVNGIYQVEILNSMGVSVYNNIISQDETINLSDMPAGVYFIKANSEMQYTVQSIIIK